MTVYFQIAELSDMAVRSINVYMLNGPRNGTNARAAIGIPLGADSYSFFESPIFSATDMWVHFVASARSVTTPRSDNLSRSMFRIFSGSTPCFRVSPMGRHSVVLQRWNGTTWVNIGQYDQQELNGDGHLLYYDIHLQVGPTATITVYINGTVAMAVTNFDSTFGGTVSAFTKCIWGCPDLNYGEGTYCFTELAGTDWNTIGCKLISRAPVANGYYSEWTDGDYTTVDEYGVGGDFATSDVENQRVDWQVGTFPTLAANEQITNVKVSALLNRDTLGPQTGNFYIRQGSVDYDAPEQLMPLVQGSVFTNYELNPANSNVWTINDLNGSTFGVRSRP